MPLETDSVAVNTGPLIALAACQELDLLRRLHSRVLVPPQVVEEYQQGGSGATAGLPDWVEVRRLTSGPEALLLHHLDQDEASAIALALQEGVGLVLTDERRGRLVARSVGLTVTGSVGILLRAKRVGLIDAVRPRLEAMHASGVWLASSLMERVLVAAGEQG